MTAYICDKCNRWLDSREAGFNVHVRWYVCDECLADREEFVEALANTPLDVMGVL